MANKIPTSLSLSNSAIAALDGDNKSAIPNLMLETLITNRIAIDYIKSTFGSVDYKLIVELGVEALKTKADKHRDLQRFTQAMSEPQQPQAKSLSKDIFVRDNVCNCATWQQLVELAAENHIDLSSLFVSSAISYHNHPFYNQDNYLMRATQGDYRVNRSGQIVKM